MKRLLISLITLGIGLAFIGCQSIEQRAEKVIEQDMFNNLYDFNSYEVISTIVDSAFANPFIDKQVLGYAKEIVNTLDEFDELFEQYDKLGVEMKYNILPSNSELKKYRQQVSELNGKNKELSDKTVELQDSINNLCTSYDSKFIGWRVAHKFRCKTYGGHSDIGQYVYFIDENMKNILFKFDNDDEDFQACVENIVEAINDNEDLELYLHHLVPESLLEQ